jgi:hypothetical protein
VALILVCQPGPVARNASTTSRSRRSLSGTLGLADLGRRLATADVRLHLLEPLLGEIGYFLVARA